MIGWVPALALLALAAPAAGTAGPPLEYPHLHATLFELRAERQEMVEARDEFGGHRVQALRAVEDAIVSLKLILRVKGDDVRGVNRNPDFYRRYKDHPHMRQALDDLRDARGELRDAKADIGNLRERGLRDINAAIEQIQVALRYARR